MPVKPPFQFLASTFVSKGWEQGQGDWDETDRADIETLRALHPELALWGDLAIGAAFASYSQAFHLISWAHWMVGRRDDSFLNYCCWRQTRGLWTLGDEEAALALADDWRQAHTLVP